MMAAGFLSVSCTVALFILAGMFIITVAEEVTAMYRASVVEQVAYCEITCGSDGVIAVGDTFGIERKCYCVDGRVLEAP
jgi:hypothetical protein